MDDYWHWRIKNPFFEDLGGEPSLHGVVIIYWQYNHHPMKNTRVALHCLPQQVAACANLMHWHNTKQRSVPHKAFNWVQRSGQWPGNYWKLSGRTSQFHYHCTSDQEGDFPSQLVLNISQNGFILSAVDFIVLRPALSPMGLSMLLFTNIGSRARAQTVEAKVTWLPVVNNGAYPWNLPEV